MKKIIAFGFQKVISIILSIIVSVFAVRMYGIEFFGIFTYNLILSQVIANAAVSGATPDLVDRWNNSTKLDYINGIIFIILFLVFTIIFTIILLKLFQFYFGLDLNFKYLIYTFPLLIYCKLVAIIYQSIASFKTYQAVESIFIPSTFFILYTSNASIIEKYPTENTLIQLYILCLCGIALTLTIALIIKLKAVLLTIEAYSWTFLSLSFLLRHLSYARSNVLVNFQKSIDLLIIGNLSDATTLGIYRIASQISKFTSFGLQISSVFFRARISKDKKLSDKSFLRNYTQKLNIFNNVIAVSFILIVWLFPDILMNMYNLEHNNEFQSILHILIIGQFISVLFGNIGIVITMTGNQIVIYRIGLVLIPLSIISYVIIIQIYGVIGAAIVFALLQLAFNSTLTVWAQRYLRFTTLLKLKRT